MHDLEHDDDQLQVTGACVTALMTRWQPGGGINQIHIRDVIIKGDLGQQRPVAVFGIEVPLDVRFDGAQIEQRANFYGFRFKRGLAFGQDCILPQLNLASAHVEGRLFIGSDHIGLYDVDSPASAREIIAINLTEVVVDGDLLLTGHIGGNVVLSNAQVKGNAVLKSLGPLIRHGDLKASDLSVGRTLTLEGFRADENNALTDFSRLTANRFEVKDCIFLKGLTATSSVLGDLVYEGPKLQKGIDQLFFDISRSRISRSMSITGGGIVALNATGVLVAGSARIENLTIEQLLVLDLSTFSSLSLINVSHRSAKEWIQMDGMSFTALRAAAEIRDTTGPKWVRPTMDLPDQATFSTSAYQNMEQFLLRQGLPGEAEDVFFKMKRRQLRQLGFTPSALLGWFQYSVLGYGRTWTYPLLWSLLFVGLGVYLFRQERKMDVIVNPTPSYSPGWYSLELFLPFVKLGQTESRRPGAQHRALTTYWRVHQLAGWVLVPVALAALTGAIK